MEKKGEMEIQGAGIDYMENKVFTLPLVTDGVREIGELWDCRRSRQVGIPIFIDSELRGENPGYLDAYPVQDMRYVMSHMRNSQDKSSALHVSAEVSLELAGIIKVTGAASFDKKDAKDFKEEELLCELNMQTFVVRTRPSVRKIVDPEVKEKILDGRISATHFVSEVRLGGSVFASLRFNSNMTHDSLTLEGSFGGSMPVGPVSVGLKGELKLIDSKSGSQYSKIIKITSIPSVSVKSKEGEASGEDDVTNDVEEMFEKIESLPSIVETKLYKEELFKSPKVYGIPIMFKLTPISTLFELAIPPTYILIEKAMLADFQDMMLTLNDFEGMDYYKGLICEQDLRLIALFPDKPGFKDSMHPWAAEVVEKQEQLNKLANELKINGFEIYNKYKKGEAEVSQISQILQKYNNEFNFPAIQLSVLDYATKGKILLNAIRSTDASLTRKSDIFIFSKKQRDDYWNPSDAFRILLTTDENADPPPGTFIKLYTMAPNCEAFGIDVRVACPHPDMERGFNLHLKMEYTTQIYSGEEITTVLDMLEHIFAVQSRLNTNASRFYSILAPASGFIHLDKIKPTELIDNINGIRSVYLNCANTRLQTLELLSQSTTGVVLVLLPEYLGSAWKAFLAYRKLATNLKEAGVQFSTIVGCFDILEGMKEGPFLLVYVNSVLEAVCHNPLDCRILLQLLVDGNNLELLSAVRKPEYSLTPGRQEMTPKLLDSLGIVGPLFESTSPFDIPTPKFYNETLYALFKACFSPVWEISSIVASVVIPIYDGILVPILTEYGWNKESGFKEQTDWETLITDIKDLNFDTTTVFRVLEKIKATSTPANWVQCLEPIQLSSSKQDLWIQIAESLASEQPDEEILSEVISLLENFQEAEDELRLLLVDALSLEFPDTGMNKSKLSNICTYFVRKVFPDNESEIRKFRQLFDENQYVEALGIFTDIHYNGNYAILQYYLDKIVKFTNPSSQEVVLEFLPHLEKFELAEQEWVWRNPSFRYWIECNSNQTVIAQVQELFCDLGQIPDWIPLSTKTAVLELMQKTVGLPVTWSTVWMDRSEMMEAFRFVIARRRVPADFNFVLMTNVRNNSELLHSLEHVGALYNWNSEEKYFSPPWSLSDIETALILLMDSTKIPEKPEVDANLAIMYRPSAVELEPDGVSLNSAWQAFSDGNLKRLSLKLFTQVQEPSLTPPRISASSEEIKGSVTRVSDYIWKELRQGNTSALDMELVERYVEYRPQIMQPKSESDFIGCMRIFSRYKPDENEVRGSVESFVSRSDWITVLLTNTDPTVSIYLMTVLARSYSIPMFIPDIRVDELKVRSLTSYLPYVKIHQLDGDINQINLLVPPYKLIVAVRVGYSSIGKSTLLNQSALTRPIFSSRFDRGNQYGIPITRNGLVELTWMSKETIQSDLYENTVQPFYESQHEMVLLANVHGDVLDMPPELLEKLVAFSSGFVVFWKCKNWAEMKEKNEMLGSLIGLKPSYNLVLNPGSDVLSKVDEQNIIFTDSGPQIKPKLQAALKEMIHNAPSITTLTPHRTLGIDLTCSEELLKCIRTSSVGRIRSSLKLQSIDRGNVVDIIKNPLWKCVMDLYARLLSLPMKSRIPELYNLQWKLEEMSMKSSSDSLRRLLKLQHELAILKDDETVRLLRDEMCIHRQLTLDIGHLDRELEHYFRILNNNSLSTEYFKICKENFENGVPLEMILDPQSQIMDYCFNPDTKLFVISILGVQGSYKSTLLNNLFGSGFRVGQGGCTHGVVMQLLTLDAPLKSQCSFDGILLLDSEGFQPVNEIEDDALRRMVTFLLASSHLSLVCVDNGKIEFIKGVLEVALVSICRNSSALRIQPDVLFIDHPQPGVLNTDLTQEMEQLLSSVQTHLLQEVVTTGTKCIDALELLWARVIGNTLVHQIGTGPDYHPSQKLLHQHIISQMTECQGTPNWYVRTRGFWEPIVSDPVTSFVSLTAVKADLASNSQLEIGYRSLEATWKSHMDLMPQGEYPDEMHIKQLNSVPYACRESGCRCQAAVATMQEIIFSDSEKPYSDLFDIYSSQIQDETVGLLTQIAASQEIRNGKDGSLLASYLDSIIADPTVDRADLWLRFKCYIAGQMVFPSWTKLIESQIEMEYGTWVLERVLEGVLPKLQHIPAFDNRHEWSGLMTPVDFVNGAKLTWEQSTWLVLQLTAVTRRSGGTSGKDIYHSGIVRSLRESIHTMIEDEFTRICPHTVSLPEFKWEIHVYALILFVQTWKNMEVEWLVKNDPLVQLEKRRNEFPENIFVPSD